MENIYSEYKLYHIVSLNRNLIKNKFFNLFIEDQEFLFRIVRVATQIIEVKGYVFLDELSINDNFNLIEDYLNNSYNFFSIPFEESENDEKINTPIGIYSLDLDLNISFKEIENADSPLTKKLKYLILNEYEYTIFNNTEALIKKEIDYQNELNKREELLKEIQKLEKEREQKWKELNKRLNSNTPQKKNYMKILR